MKTARVITASTRASAGEYTDRTGPVIVSWLREQGFEVPDSAVVADGEPVTTALSGAFADNVDVVITTGGTGISPSDETPQRTAELLDYELPGLADAIRAAGLPKVPASVLSRGVAGVVGRTLVINLPGSTGGVKDGLGVLSTVLDHAVDQLRGGDHNGHGKNPVAVQRETGVLLAEVTESYVDAAAHAALVASRSSGAVVSFAGVVRDHDHGRSVTELEYSGHPSAQDVIAEVAADILKQFPALNAIAVSHRVGPLKIGDTALACAVSSAHRKDAFVACAELVDEVKRRLPIWKRQVFTDGTDEWVNCP
ncbi:molybdenum cofactor biosynthesis protein MoaB [Pseudonocardiaceae bacterium YIM PH 21723]|nr:molybdenum cofactor biosynthesis protein MoaB [Pseudonocardiaceae bacterium YIM PH 21723]